MTKKPRTDASEDENSGTASMEQEESSESGWEIPEFEKDHYDKDFEEDREDVSIKGFVENGMVAKDAYHWKMDQRKMARRKLEKKDATDPQEKTVTTQSGRKAGGGGGYR